MIKEISNANENVTANSYELNKLKQALPQCFTSDGSFNMEVFKSILDGNVNITNEGYELKFLGKSYARLLASLDTETIIVPDEEHNNLPENVNSENIYITGDNLDALKHLLKSYEGKIKCIYIDPPYNTGSDEFAYNDKFVFTKDELVRKLSIDEEHAERILDLINRGSASHSAWLTFMFPRLLLARDLLAKDGAMFISIDDNEQANLRLVCDSIFGEENFVAVFPWRKRTAKSDVPFGVSQDYEVIVCYAKTDKFIAGIEKNTRRYFETDDFPGREWRYHDLTKQTTAQERPNSYFTIVNPKNGSEYPADANRTWAITEETFCEYYAQNRIIFPGDYDFLNIKRPVLRYWKDEDIAKAGDRFGMIAVSTKLPDDIGMTQNGTQEVTELFGTKVFGFPKPVGLVKYLLNFSACGEGICLDFFSGSATTAHAIMQQNVENGSSNKYIMVQLPEPTKVNSTARNAGYETIDQIGRERIIRAAAKIREENPDTKADLGFKHYVLQDVPEKKLIELEDFDPDAIFAEDELLKYFTKPTVLTTWLVKDGHGFNAKVEEIKLADYTAYYCNNHLYFLDTDFDDEAMKALYEKYDAEVSFKTENVVLFGYSFTWVQTALLKDNLKKLKAVEDNKNVNVIVRY